MSPTDCMSPRIQNRIWHNRNFLLLWLGTITTFLAGSILKLALPIFAARITRSPLLVSTVTFSFTAPWLLVGLQSGALVDRHDRRRTLLTGAVICLTSLVILTATTSASGVILIVLYGAALTVGVAETLIETATTAMVPMIVSPRYIDGANARLIGAQQLVEIVTSPVGGALASVGLSAVAGLAGAGYALAFVPLFFLRGALRPGRQSSRGLTRDVVEGAHFLWRKPALRTIGIMAAVINACWSAWLALLVLYAVSPGPMHLTAFQYGLLFIGSGVGGVVSTALVGPVQRRFGRRSPIGINIVGNALMLATPGVTANPWMVAAAVAIRGIVGPMWTVAAVSFQYRVVPAALQGRVSSAYQFLGLGATAIGPLLGGILAQIYGVRAVFVAGGALTLMMIVPFLRAVSDEAMEGGEIKSRICCKSAPR